MSKRLWICVCFDFCQLPKGELKRNGGIMKIAFCFRARHPTEFARYLKNESDNVFEQMLLDDILRSAYVSDRSFVPFVSTNLEILVLNFRNAQQKILKDYYLSGPTSRSYVVNELIIAFRKNRH